ncbi:Chromate resistance protein ChrB [Nonomuraea sp. CA-143628]|uniref:Chromate resistance protein ChrB n=1 Tax=Nonomuraea sp. CA-143628 TaxID=3239997 RepID=UPI003D9423AA
MTEGTDEQGWLLISVSTAGAAPTLRVQVWRKLRSLGALYLQQSVCLLPEREQTLRQVRRLLDRVRQQGGTGRLLHVALTDQAEERQVIGEFNAARDTEYAEVLERLPAFRQELARERELGRATYAEVEESEADLERFRSWLGKIAARDYFAAPAGAAARAGVEEAAADLAAFEQDALAAESPATEASLTVPARTAAEAPVSESDLTVAENGTGERA